MTPSEIDQKIRKLMRLAAQRDNAQEARTARQVAHRLAKKYGRDIDAIMAVPETKDASNSDTEFYAFMSAFGPLFEEAIIEMIKRKRSKR